ncbi:MAG: hypothetical protein COV07_01430 [Candidatus Vogelbacteria bacterium CG10_big_fil_rev_8_21_14_0_10_45_14]|uniref:Uncharacterized protein n=1 Tax=Candidatus Vogelbacteria bacterium CG10_big_fil_rev_8_21_14_0_10_45_14 TaxID=1975042 RepID=A0A2H0RKC0_9BACT|nr:MAG: hypothetical protein COV07_01430 [Candidatus Vogelbacteria bacterium CG10_big_fil_rev_8_21_14_0_10_45_14]
MARTITAYFRWHYVEGVRDLVSLWRDLIVFLNHFFSIPLLLRTLFYPWRRMDDKRRNGSFDPSGFFEDMIVSLLMRLVGLWVRLPTIFVGVILLVLMIVLFPVIVLLWLILPLFAIVFIISGLFVAIFGL